MSAEQPATPASGAEGGAGLSSAAGLRAVVEGLGVDVSGLAAKVYIGCVEDNVETALFVKRAYEELEYTGIVLGAEIPAQNRMAAVTSAECVAFLLSPEAVESMYDNEAGLGAQIKATIETKSKYILLATPKFKWSLVDPKKLAWGVKDLYLEDFLTVEDEEDTDFPSSLDGRMVAPANAATIMAWWKTIILTLFTALAPGAFVLAFSGMGFGDVVFQALSLFYGWYTVIAILVAVVIFLFLYLFDFSYWTGKWKGLRTILFIITVICTAAGIVTAAKRYAAAPQALFMVGVPAYLFIIKRAMFRRDEISAFLGSLSVALAFSASAVIGVWIWYLTWPGIGMWGDALRTRYRLAMSCTAQEYCLAAFLLWLSPLVAAVASYVFALMTFFLSRSVSLKGGSRLQAAMKMFGMLLAMSLLGIWIAASIAGASMGMANIVMMFCAAAAVVLGGTIVALVGWKSLKTKIGKMPFLKKLQNSSLLDWVFGTLVLVASPVFVVYLFLSMINQFLRNHFSCIDDGYADKPGARESLLTLVARNQLDQVKTWKWSSVLTKTVWIGVFFILINVGVGKLTTLFLSWLNTVLSTLPIAVIFVVFFAVGLFMFLLPPVPGLPVYITGGIILVSAVQKTNYWLGVALACITCYVIKLTAIAVQQKIIGQGMSGNVAVRNFVGVNSISIRAIRRVLAKPGLSIGKVAILIGGPDWPTSVLTGIMKLSLVQMLIGSLPVALLVVPTVLAGAFELKKGESEQWASIASVTLSVAAIVQSGALLAAMYYIERTVSSHREELEAEEIDEEVAKCERKQALVRVAYLEATRWDLVPIIMRLVLILAALLQAVAAWVIFFDSDGCFESFEVTDSISKPPLNGNALNMFKFQGVVISIIFLASVVLLYVFKIWANTKAKKAMAGGEFSSAAQLVSVEVNRTEPSSSTDSAVSGVGAANVVELGEVQASTSPATPS